MEEESPIRLKNEATKLLIRRLTSTTQKQLDAISIVGIAGIGNTSLAKTVYENPSVVYHFHTRIWFTVSHFRDNRKILCHILTCLKSRFDSCSFRCMQFLIENESWVLLEENLGKKKRKEILFTKGNVWSSRMSGQVWRKKCGGI